MNRFEKAKKWLWDRYRGKTISEDHPLFDIDRALKVAAMIESGKLVESNESSVYYMGNGSLLAQLKKELAG